jgi:class 3 adenylate cyclase
VLSYVYPGLALVFTSGSLISYKYLTEEREKKRTKQVFSHYLDQAVIDQVIDQPDKLKLGGEKHSLTVLFSDIKGFSTFSEQMSPQELVGFLNTYFDEMTEIIFKYQGTLDKLIGDAVMCFWGHPVETEEHPLRATIAALEMMQVVRQIQESVNLPGGHRFDIRIGVNTGDMVVGNMGSQHRFSYTVMGDDVNLGARLEPLNKYYGTNILISGSTYEKIKDRIFCRELDRVTVKGKEHPVTIYEPLGLRRPEREQRVSERRSDPTLWKRFKGAYVAGRHGERRRSDRRQGSAELLVDPKWDEIRTIFEHALELYRIADFDGAEQAFDHVMKLAPGDGHSLMMKSRIEKFRLELVDAKSEFDPVHKFDEK